MINMAKKGWHGQSARHSLASRGFKTPSCTRKSPSKSASTKLRWKPSDKRTINVTYNIVTPESAKDGDVEESGFEKEGVEISSIDDIISIFEECGGATEGSGFSYYTIDPERDYTDGSEKRYGIHFSRNFTGSEMDGILKKLGEKRLVRHY